MKKVKFFIDATYSRDALEASINVWFEKMFEQHATRFIIVDCLMSVSNYCIVCKYIYTISDETETTEENNQG